MNARVAIKILLVIVAIATALHLAILTKVISYEIAWGGRLENDNAMYVFESFSLFLNLFLAFVLLTAGNYIKRFISIKFERVILWIFLVLFSFF